MSIREFLAVGAIAVAVILLVFLTRSEMGVGERDKEEAVKQLEKRMSDHRK